MHNGKHLLLLLTMIIPLLYGAEHVSAQTVTTSYVPLIGITSVPEPLWLAAGGGTVTYHYAVKNFLRETALNNVTVIDNTCSPVVFDEGDDSNDGNLDYSETWRYVCTTTLSTTTENTATAAGSAHGMTATHSAYATVVVGSNNPAPLVSIVNVTKVAYPLSLPIGGGPITFTYKVNNPGAVPLSDVRVTDDKCANMSSKLGDTNGNNLLDMSEVWVYTCTTSLTETTTNTVTATAFANNLKAVGYATITITVDTPSANPVPDFPDTGTSLPPIKVIIWGTLLGAIAILGAILVITRKK